MGKIFGTDGVRGIAGGVLTCELAMAIGKATATVLGKRSPTAPLVIVGKDTRKSSDMLEMAVCAGLCACGAKVLCTGVMPTPAVAYLVKSHQAQAGVMISASHNSYEDNGIKLFGYGGYKLTDEQEIEIERLILGEDAFAAKSRDEIGTVKYEKSLHQEYVRHILESVPGVNASQLKIVVDCSNGSASRTAGAIFDALGCKYTLEHAHPDGMNINKNCGSTCIEWLCQRVVEQGYDLGIAFDGDADRMIAVDHLGNIVDGDMLVAMLALEKKRQGCLNNNTVVVTVMSNLGFMKFAEAHGITAIQTKVGDRYVLEAMLAGGHNLGGEQSGHIILSDYMTTGDGQLSAVQLIRLLCQSNETLQERTKIMKKYPQMLMNVTVDDDIKARYQDSLQVQEAIALVEKRLEGEGRVLVRPSGTESMIRVMVEAKDEETASQCVETIIKAIRKIV